MHETWIISSNVAAVEPQTAGKKWKNVGNALQFVNRWLFWLWLQQNWATLPLRLMASPLSFAVFHRYPYLFVRRLTDQGCSSLSWDRRCYCVCGDVEYATYVWQKNKYNITTVLSNHTLNILSYTLKLQLLGIVPPAAFIATKVDNHSLLFETIVCELL